MNDYQEYNEFKNLGLYEEYGLLKYTENDDLLTSGQISKLTGVSTETVRRWVKKGNLKNVSMGSHIRVPVGDLKLFLFYKDKRIKH